MSTEKKQRTLCVTSAEGWTGKYVLECAKEKASFDRIIVCASDAAKVSVKGVDVCTTPHGDVSAHTEAFRSADCIIMIPPASGDKVQETRHMLEACKKAKVKHVVLASSVGHEAGKDLPRTGQFCHIEQMLQDSGLPDYAILRLDFYAENLLLYAPSIKEHGELPLPIQKGTRIAAVSAQDCARVLVAVANECGGKHHDKVYTITGKQALGPEDMAKCMSHVAGRDIKYKHISDEEAGKLLAKTSHLDLSEREYLLELYVLAEKGHLERTSNDFEQLTGSQPMPLADVLKKHSKELK
jgi:uncharacterized protein YbjT (DUF2867 family)